MVMPATVEALQHGLAELQRGLKDFVPPSGPFDPQGSWNHVYRIFNTMRFVAADVVGGDLTLRRTAAADSVRLDVRQRSIMRSYRKDIGKVARPEQSPAEHRAFLQLLERPYDYCVEASIQCAPDSWSTPRQFTAETWTTGGGKEVPGSRLKFAARTVGTEIRFSGLEKPPLRVTTPWTLDWALLDTLQRLPLGSPEQFVVDVVEDCDQLRPQQRLAYAGSVTTKLGGTTTELHGFCRVGTGTLPAVYWLDEQHRLLFAITAYWTWILQPVASNGEKAK